MSGPSLLDAHLAEIDRRLRAIQDGLAAESADAQGAAAQQPDAPRIDGSGASIAVTAGPFVATDAVARFHERLRALPGVREVRLREYEGPDQAVFEVRLDEPIS